LRGKTIVHTLQRCGSSGIREGDANLRTHGIGFAEAVTVLEDAFAVTREDPDAVGEDRFVTLGLSDQANLLIVVYAYREPDIIRVEGEQAAEGAL
jgi:uncharacterized protein